MGGWTAGLQRGRVKIAITGSTGLIGTALLRELEASGHAIIRLVRTKGAVGPRAVLWDPETGIRDPAPLEGFDALVHLAGENLASGRWTAARKTQLRHSRVHATRKLSESLVRLSTPPRTMVCASAIGIYGDRGDAVLTEESPAGQGFLARLCQEWEAAAASARAQGIRVVFPRLGIVLAQTGGALGRMLPAFRLGLGGPLGTGRQFWSWIALQDVIGAVVHILADAAIAGPVNLTAPQPVTQSEFARTLGQVLHRPAVLPAPAWALRLAVGEMADQALLASARVIPATLTAQGYRFRFPELRSALSSALGGGQGGSTVCSL